jgi:hypothetical protein
MSGQYLETDEFLNLLSAQLWAGETTGNRAAFKGRDDPPGRSSAFLRMHHGNLGGPLPYKFVGTVGRSGLIKQNAQNVMKASQKVHEERNGFGR